MVWAKANDSAAEEALGLVARGFETRKEHYDTLLDKMEIRPSWQRAIDAKAAKIIRGKKLYKQVAKQIEDEGHPIPWQVIGVIHMMEGDCDFGTHLHNGDSLQRRTRQVPAGRPKTGKPPFTWQESALDALMMHDLHQVEDWSMARICYELERYNGWGYLNKGIETPYLWSGSNIYTKGKYVRDGVYDADHVSQQVGAIPLLKRIVELDVDKEEVVKNSTKLSTLQSIRAWLVLTFGTYFTADSLWGIPEYIKNFTALGLGPKDFVLVGLGAVLWAVISYVKYKTTNDFKEGRYIPSNMEEPPVEFHKDTLL